MLGSLRTSRYARWLLGAVQIVIVSALVSIGLYSFLDTGDTHPTLTAPLNNEGITPVNDEQRQMLAQFRLATPAEYSAIREIKDFNNDPASWHVYVAVSDGVVLSRINTPIVLVLAVGHRWVAGQQGNVIILRARSEEPHDILSGSIFASPMCKLAQAGVLKSDCYSAIVNTPNDWDEMTSHTRKATAAEMKRWNFTGDPANYLVATSDLRIAPEYAFDDVPEYEGVKAVIVPTGIKVVGGHLGYMDVYVLDKSGNIRVSALDAICFMNEVGKVNPDADSHSFAPVEELERVKRCKR